MDGATPVAGDNSSGGGEDGRLGCSGRSSGGILGTDSMESGGWILGWITASTGLSADADESSVLTVWFWSSPISMLGGMKCRPVLITSRFWLNDRRSPRAKSSVRYAPLGICSDTDLMWPGEKENSGGGIRLFGSDIVFPVEARCRCAASRLYGAGLIGRYADAGVVLKEVDDSDLE
jgi:hypothetical protein